MAKSRKAPITHAAAGSEPASPVVPEPVAAQPVADSDAVAAPRKPRVSSAVKEEKKRMRYINSPMHPRMILAKQRRERALQMRIAGLSEREIARRLGVSNMQVTRMLKTSLETLNKSEMNKVSYVRRTELERLDEMLTGLMPNRRDPRYVDSILRIMERRAAYLGTDAPSKSEVVSRVRVTEQEQDLSMLSDDDLVALETILAKCEKKKVVTEDSATEEPGDDGE